MNRKNKDLRVVRDSEDVDKLVRRIMDNTEDEETQMAQLEEQVKAHKKKIRIRILIVVILIMAASVGGEHLSGGGKYGQQLQGIFRRCASLQ